MIETRSMVACPDCQTYWAKAGEVGCSEPGHRHQRFELHLQRSAVVLPDGTPVIPVSCDASEPYRRDQAPDYGLYLDDRWRPPWSHDHLDWPDFGLPAHRGGMVTTLGSLLGRARTGQCVEIGCLGGHGRTGTALACLAVLASQPADDAVGWVRANYCARAVETSAQEAFVLEMTNQP